MIPQQSRTVTHRAMAVQTDAPSAHDTTTSASAAASGSGRSPPLGALESGRIVASPQQPPLTTAGIARATNKTLEEVRPAY